MPKREEQPEQAEPFSYCEDLGFEQDEVKRVPRAKDQHDLTFMFRKWLGLLCWKQALECL